MKNDILISMDAMLKAYRKVYQPELEEYQLPKNVKSKPRKK